jgi:hypothetical protein
MDSVEMLRLWSGTSWPADDFSVEENWEDLARHEREHGEREAFTFTVLDSTRSVCLGCVYIQPLAMALRGSYDAEASLSRETPCVSFWVRAPRQADGLDRRLLAQLRVWLAECWAFPLMYVCVRQDHRQQWKSVEAEGLALVATIDVEDRDPVRLYQIG